MSGGDLYGCLGIAKTASSNEIRKAYLSLSRTHHPDKGGDPEEFKKIQKAYEVLSDEQRRAHYDMTGSDEEGGPPGPGGMPFPFPFDLGSIFGGLGAGLGAGLGGFGPMPGMRAPGAPRKRQGKPDPKVHEIPISLWDYYHGKDITIQFERHKFCEACKGEGTDRLETCGGCGGNGTRQTVVMMGPGMQGVMRGPCPDCSGRGKKAVGTCGSCKGSKTKTQEKVLTSQIRPGMRPGEVLIFPGECSDNPEYTEVGDVHIILQEADEENQFRRQSWKSDDLRATLEISLKEALLGCEKTLYGHPAHPFGYKAQITPGVQNGEDITIEGEGMPRRDGGKGSLHLQVIVTATAAERAVLVEKKELLESLFSGV